MYFEPKTITLKDGRTAILRSPLPEQDAEDMRQYLLDICGETEFVLGYPEDWGYLTVEKEQEILQRHLDDQDGLMIVAEVDGRIAGNCHIGFNRKIKTYHRGSIAIGLRKAYWNLGIGTALFREMIDIARQRGGVRQLELEFVEGNCRARALYEKMGFRITGMRPNAIRLKDGTLLNEYEMMLEL